MRLFILASENWLNFDELLTNHQIVRNVLDILNAFWNYCRLRQRKKHSLNIREFMMDNLYNSGILLYYLV